MIEHGIHTSVADYWVHVLPVQRWVSWYRRDHMLAHIASTKPPVHFARSKDGTSTGAGYLVPRTAPFILRGLIPPRLIDGHDWEGMTDRELGREGEALAYRLIENNIVRFPMVRVTRLRSKADQCSGKDCVVDARPHWTLEIKSERPPNGSVNLFVQTQEGDHRPNLIPDGSGERVTDLQGYNEGEGLK